MNFKKNDHIKYEYYVYRYTDKRTGEIVYIGKTNRSLKARVNAHKREEWFAPYDCNIDCVKLSNEVETDSVEKFLINLYKPAINLKDKIPFLTKEISLEGLNWIPYEVYLESLTKSSSRMEMLKKMALTQVDLVDAICESDGISIIFPSVVSTLPCLEGLLEFADKEVSTFDGGYKYNLVFGVKEYIEEHYDEILASIWMPVVQISNISDRYAEDFATCDYGFEVLSLLKEFAYNGYQMEEEDERFVVSLAKKYESTMKYFEPYVGKVRCFSDTIYFEWSYENEENVPNIVKSICKDFIRLTRMDEIWNY